MPDAPNAITDVPGVGPVRTKVNGARHFAAPRDELRTILAKYGRGASRP